MADDTYELGDLGAGALAACPEDYKQAGVFLLISGLMNVMLGFVWGCVGVSACVSTWGLCFFCPFVGLVPMGWGVWEILEGNKMRAGVWSPGVRTSNLVGLVLALMSFHWIGVVCQALVLVNLGKPEVKAWLDTPQG